LRLFCLPHAGGGPAVFRAWPDHLAPDVEVLAVQLPGRAARLRESPCGNLASLAGALASAIEPLLDLPYAFFGYSLGALVAFEAVRELRRRGRPSPEHLFVVSRRGPRVRDPGPPVHRLPDAAFIREVQTRYPGGIPDAVLHEADLLELLLPSLRADLEMLETYEYHDDDPLDCPVMAVRGRDDAHAPLDSVKAWSHETRGSFTAREYPGGHFFFRGKEAELLNLVRGSLGVAPQIGPCT